MNSNVTHYNLLRIQLLLLEGIEKQLVYTAEVVYMTEQFCSLQKS